MKDIKLSDLEPTMALAIPAPDKNVPSTAESIENSEALPIVDRPMPVSPMELEFKSIPEPITEFKNGEVLIEPQIVSDSSDSDDGVICLRSKRSRKFVICDTTDEESDSEPEASDLEAIDDSEIMITDNFQHLKIQNMIREIDDFEEESEICKKLSLERQPKNQPLALPNLTPESEERPEIERLKRKRRRTKAWKMERQRRVVAKKRKILFD